MFSIRLMEIVVLLLTLSASWGYETYRDLIPNGRAVPNPCRHNTIWEGVGHYVVRGGSWRNQFGRDFMKVGKTWTKALCLLDSDGDGMTNGDELGDPNCVWTPGAQPDRLEGITHPGICDPWYSERCMATKIIHPAYKTQENWMTQICERGEELECDALEDEDVSIFNVRLSYPVQVPNKVTTHFFQVLDAPDGDLHVVAFEPLNVSPNLVHHITVFGCLDYGIYKEIQERGKNFMGVCPHIIAGWSVGIGGYCFPPNTGIPIGQGSSGFTKIGIEVHYHNPDQIGGVMDTSGLKFYYTKKKRMHDSYMILAGSGYFVLPPGHNEVIVSSTCTDVCTEKALTDKVYLIFAVNHMHLLGTAMSIELRRNGSHHMYLTNQPEYDYDNPYFLEFIPPIEMRPGDELVTTCVYDTRSTNTTTFYGEGIKNEMCFSNIGFYPKVNFLFGFDYCVTHNEMIPCDPRTYADCKSLYQWANPDVFQSTPYFHEIASNCEQFGPCRKECVDLLLKYRNESKCLEDKYTSLLKGSILPRHEPGREVMARLASCEVEVDRILNANLFDTSDSSKIDESSTKTGSYSYATRVHDSIAIPLFITQIIIVVTSELLWQ